MTDLVTDEIVEAAADAIADAYDDMTQDDIRSMAQIEARAALDVAAPLIAARAQLDLLADLLAKGMWDVRYVENEYPIQAVPKSLLLEHRNRISRGMKETGR